MDRLTGSGRGLSNRTEMGAPPPGQPGMPGPGMPGGAPPASVPNNLILAILVTLFCCLPGGIVAIVFATQVNSKLAAGDVAGAMDASKKAKMISLISAGIGLAFIIIYVILMVVVGVGGGMSSY